MSLKIKRKDIYYESGDFYEECNLDDERRYYVSGDLDRERKYIEEIVEDTMHELFDSRLEELFGASILIPATRAAYIQAAEAYTDFESIEEVPIVGFFNGARTYADSTKSPLAARTIAIVADTTSVKDYVEKHQLPTQDDFKEIQRLLHGHEITGYKVTPKEQLENRLNRWAKGQKDAIYELK